MVTDPWVKSYMTPDPADRDKRVVVLDHAGVAHHGKWDLYDWINEDPDAFFGSVPCWRFELDDGSHLFTHQVDVWRWERPGEIDAQGVAEHGTW